MANGNFTISADASDLERLFKKLRKLEDIDTSIPIKKAFAEGGDELKNKAKASIVAHQLIDTGAFKTSPTRSLRRKKKYGPGVYVGFKRGAAHGNIAHLVDAGTAERFTKKGAYRGRITPTYFWTKISNSDAPVVMENIMDKIEDEIDKLLK